AAAAVQAGLGLWRHDALRLVLAGLGLSAAGGAALPADADWPARAFVAFHLGVFALLAIGAAFDDQTGRGFRLAGSAMVLFAGVLGRWVERWRGRVTNPVD